MPKGVCDPAPAAYNETGMWLNNGTVGVTIRWTWDGVSVFPECDGPVVSVRAVNTSDAAWSVRLPRARRTVGRRVTLQPGDDVTVSGSTLANRGYETYSDCLDLLMTLD